MSSCSELDTSTAPDELEIVKDQLDTYQRLNTDLSKKIQEMKIALSAANRELEVHRNDLRIEKIVSSELRRSMSVLVGQVNGFFNGYVSNLQTVIQRTNLNITMPGEDSRTLSRPRTAVERPTRTTPDPGAPNLIYTICEEPSMTSLTETLTETANDSYAEGIDEQRTRFSSKDKAIFASTPLSTAQCSKSAAPSCSKPDDEYHQRIQSNLDDETQASVQASLAGSPRPNSPVESITDTPKRATPENRQSSNVSETPIESSTEEEPEDQASSPASRVVDCSVDVAKVDLNASVVEEYIKRFSSEPRESSVESNVSSYSESTQMTTQSEPTSSISGTTRKPRAEVKPRRSTGRPKRKVRLCVGSLAEKSLLKKLRRS